jgi:thioredoxin-dependent peroxiredoxin
MNVNMIKTLFKTTGLFLCAILLTALSANAESAPPTVGSQAKDFTFKTLDNKTVQLAKLNQDSPVVLVVLRGWPGYQCPACIAQVHEFVQRADDFAKQKAKIVFVYPGSADNLKAHAQEFIANKEKQWPEHFFFVTDPDYAFTKSYGLRWDAPQETAYPTTFVIGKGGTVRFAKTSKTHGDRVGADTVLKELQAK